MKNIENSPFDKFMKKVESQPIFYKEFIAELTKLDIHSTLLISLTERERSCVAVKAEEEDLFAVKRREGFTKTVPILSLHRLKNVDKVLSDWTSSISKTDQIRNLWKSVLIKHNYKLDSLYDKDMGIVFVDILSTLLSDVVIGNKAKIISEINSLNIIHPKHIALPGYNIFYEDEKSYLKAIAKKETEIIKEHIIEFILSSQMNLKKT